MSPPVNLAPIFRLEGEVRVPGDKSISHRALILGALARGRTYLGGLAPGEDVAHTASCLEALRRLHPASTATAARWWRATGRSMP